MSQAVKNLIVVSQSTPTASQVAERVALFNPDGSVLTVVQTTAAMVLTGYVIGTNAVVAAADTLNVAIGKLQKQITDLDTRVDALEA